MRVRSVASSDTGVITGMVVCPSAFSRVLGCEGGGTGGGGISSAVWPPDGGSDVPTEGRSAVAGVLIVVGVGGGVVTNNQLNCVPIRLSNQLSLGYQILSVICSAAPLPSRTCQGI